MNCILLTATAPSLVSLDDGRLPAKQYLERYVITDLRQVTHITTVLAAKVGDTIKVGIKSGRLGTAIVHCIEPDYIELAQVDCQTLPPAKLDLTVVLALCRPKVLRRLIMDMTAIGVQRIVLVNSYRSQKSYWQSPMLGRLDEFVDEGLSQSMDTIAPTIDRHTRFKPFVEDVLSQWTQADSRQSAIVAHPYAQQSFDTYLSTTKRALIQYQQQHQHSDSPNSPTAPIKSMTVLPQIICIGAEGGWIDYEVALLEANGCQPVSLGRRILRTEAIVNVLCGRYIG